MASHDKPAKAYSYLRFSTPEQMKGDSQRRQLALARDYAEKHKLELDDSLTYRDQGVSAFHGANAGKDGKLGLFLEAVKAGEVPRGSYLLVENLDRLSRQTARKALRTLEDIIDAGIVVVTLMDGRQYTAEALDSDGVSLMIALLTMMRAHEESATKSRRAREAYRASVEKARQGSGVVSPKHPAWLTFDKAKNTYAVIPERQAVVRRIFTLAKQGVGKDSIAETFNRERVSVFGSGKRWHGSYIFKTLRNRAVIGELQPNERERNADGSRRIVPLEPIKDYYPAIISRKEFERVATLARASKSPRRGRHANTVSNVLGGLARCPRCGEAMTRVNKGANGGIPYLVCVKAKTGAGCKYHVVNYRELEAALFGSAVNLVGDAPAASKKGQEVEAALRANEQEQNAVIDAIERLTKAAELGKSSTPPAALSDRLVALEAELARLGREAQGYRLQLQSAAPSTVAARLRELRASLAEPRDIARANAALRLLLESVKVDYLSGRLLFNWRHGPATHLVYAWPTESQGRRGRRPTAKA